MSSSEGAAEGVAPETLAIAESSALYHRDQHENRWVLLAKNAGHNMVRALSSSLVSVLLPLVLLALLPHQEYAAWALVFSLSAYVLYLDLGIPTSVQAIVGRSDGPGNRFLSVCAAFAGLRIVAVLAVVCVAAAILAATSMGWLFPSIPFRLQRDAQFALVIATLGPVSNLVANTVGAYFAGQQRSHIPTSIIAPSRLLSMALAAVGAGLTSNLLIVSLSYSIPLLAGAIALLLRFLHEARGTKLDAPPEAVIVPTAGVKYLLGFSGPLIIWNMSMLLVSGLGLAIVARLDYQAIVPYSFATILVAAVSGVDSALMAPILPEMGRSHSRSGMRLVADLTHRITPINSAFLMITTGTLILLAPVLVRVLAPSAGNSIQEAVAITALLLVAIALRLSLTPVSLAFIATKRHHRVIVPPIVEAVVTLALSIWLGVCFGAVGVAAGALLGAILGVALALGMSLRLARFTDASASRLLSSGVVRPLTAILPAILAAAVVQSAGLSDLLSGLLISMAGLVLSVTAMWSFGISRESRQAVRGQISALRKRRGR